MKKSYIFLADGFEIVEAMGTADVLLRGGIDVRTVSVTGDNFVESAQGIPVIAKYLLKEVPLEAPEFAGEDFVSLDEIGKDDMMIFPGGMPGTSNLADCAPLMKKLREHYAAGGYIAAICAAPGVILPQLPLEDAVKAQESLRMTCYAGFENALEKKGVTIIPQKEGVVADGRLITSSGPGHAIAFGLKIIETLKDRQTAEAVAREMML